MPSTETIADLYALHHRAILVWIRNRCSVEAEDLAQEVWRRALNSLPDESNPRAWLFTVAKNVVIDWYRKQRNVPFADGQEANLPDTQARLDSPNQDRMEKLRKCLNRLSEMHRRLLVGKYIQGQSHAQLAQSLEFPSINASTQSLARAKGNLRQCMEASIQ